jgi:uncharacterized protein (TIGR02391 family)
MAKPIPPKEPQPAQLTPAQIRSGIPKLQRRLKDFAEFNVAALTEADHADKVDDLQRRTEDTLADVFGYNTVEYHRYSIGLNDGTPVSMWDGPPNVSERKSYIAKGAARAISTLESALSILTERLEDSGETAAARAINAYGGLDLHPEIARAASQLYRDGHYAHAVEDSVKALNALVRLRSGLAIDGVPLMQQAFSPKNPVLKFNDLADQSGHDEQLGFMNMFSGAVSGLRNPRAHGFIHDDPERALEFIAFVSLLAKLLDEAKKA